MPHFLHDGGKGFTDGHVRLHISVAIFPIFDHKYLALFI